MLNYNEWDGWDLAEWLEHLTVNPVVATRVGIKKPTQKNPPKKTQKKTT